MNSNVKKQLLRKDVENLYKQCSVMCSNVLRANKLPHTSFVFFKYIDFNSLFDLLETRKIKTITVVGPVKSHYKYESFWVNNEQKDNMFITSDFAVIYLNSNTREFLFTIPVWSNFLKKIIRLFRGAKVSYAFN